MFPGEIQKSGVTGESLPSAPYRFKSFKYNSHYWVLQFIAQAGRPLRIMDVGTAGGYLGAILKQQRHWLAGIEGDHQLSEQARCHYDAFHSADIEQFGFPYRNEFDCILFADVLEHLRDPQAVLRRSMACLKPGGEVIVSVPNVAHAAVRAGLLFGRFNYRDQGILDKTHLRFFTLSTITQLMNECGFRIVEVAPTPVPVQLVFPVTDHPWFAPLHEVHYALARLWKTFFAYQFVLRAVRADRRHSSQGGGAAR